MELNQETKGGHFMDYDFLDKILKEKKNSLDAKDIEGMVEAITDKTKNGGRLTFDVFGKILHIIDVFYSDLYDAYAGVFDFQVSTMDEVVLTNAIKIVLPIDDYDKFPFQEELNSCEILDWMFENYKDSEVYWNFIGILTNTQYNYRNIARFLKERL